MKYLANIIIGLATFVYGAIALAATSPVGATPGSFAVSPSGAATYSIPIQVPPGVGGMQPNLSLNYNSQGGNGIAGVGWNIGGLSAITRCGATIDRDNYKGGVYLDPRDRFCLDGSRLIGISGLPDGSPNSEYRTDIDSFSKIMAYGSQGSGPSWFKVTAKNGVTTEYGNGSSSQQYGLGGSSVVSWYVSKISDAVGNYVFSYSGDGVNVSASSQSTGEQYLRRVDYTMNSVGSAIGNVTRSVVFNYGARSDIELSYVGGGSIKTSQRLVSVQTFIGSALVRSYNLNYVNSVENRSRLVSVQECGADGVCKGPTSFDWHNSNELYTGFVGANDISDMYFSADGTDFGTRAVDVNGDGKSDLIQLFFNTNSQFYGGQPRSRVYLKSGSQYVYSDTYTNSLPNAYFSANGKDLGTRAEDVDGDGLPDLIQLFLPTDTSLYNKLPQRRVYLNNGTAYVLSSSYTNSLPDAYFSANGVDMGTRLEDINGDGRPDLIQLFLSTDANFYGGNGNDRRRVFLNTGTGFVLSDSYSNSLPNAYFSAGGLAGGKDLGTRLEDINGDGLPDLIQIFLPSDTSLYGGFSQRWVYINTGSTFVKSDTFTNSLPDTYFTFGGTDLGTRIQDVNGDGKADLIQLYLPDNSFYAGAAQHRVYLSNGIAFIYSNSFSSSLPDTYFTFGGAGPAIDLGTRIQDLNGDGLADIIQLYLPNNSFYGGNPQRRVYLNNGTSFVYSNGYSASLGLTDLYFSCGGIDLGTRLIDDNGDGKIDIIQLFFSTSSLYGGATNPQRRVYGNIGEFQSLITNVRSALNDTVGLVYKSLTDPVVYSKETGTVYPWKDVQPPLLVVSSALKSDGIGGTNTSTYFYSGMKESLTGRGNLGFHYTYVTGPDGVRTATAINLNYPYTGTAAQVDVYAPNGTRVSSTVNYWNCLVGSGSSLNSYPATTCAPALYPATPFYGNTLYMPFVSSSTTQTWELDGTALPSATTTINSVDGYGNITQNALTSSDGFSKTTTSVFFNDATNWRLGLPVKTSVTSTVPAAFSDTGAPVTSPVARTTMYVYQLGVGTWNYQLKDEVVQPSNPVADGTTYAPAYTLGVDSMVTTHAYDLTYGYQNKVTVSGTGIVARSTSTALDFVANTVTTTNALGHSEIQTLDPKFGVPLTSKGPNGLVTTWTYDGFGRKVKELRADLTATTSALTDCGTSPGCYVGIDPDSSASRYARYSSTTHVLNSSGIDMTPSVTVYYDILGREMRSETQGYNTSAIYKDTTYDSLGRVKKASRPYFTGTTAYWTTPGYDALGRTITVTTPDGAISSTSFNGLTTTMTAPTSSDGKLRTRTEDKNSQGQVVKVTDALGGKINYYYDAFGNLGKVTTTGLDSKNATITTTITSTFDIRGRKTAMNDPDMGAWSYTYDVLGELLTQKDAKLQTATMTYDLLGRMTKRVEVEGTSTWTYDTAANGKGKLASVTGPTNSYARSYVYDSLGRPAIVGTSINSVLYNMSVGYDTGTGRVTNVQFPSTVAGFGNFAFYNNYDTKGFLTAVSSLANNGGTKYWQLDANGIDAEGRVVSETMGNSTQTKRTYNPISDLLSDINTTGPTSTTVQSSHYSYFSGVPNLSSRSSTVVGYDYTETFTYDALNRVTNANITGTNINTSTTPYKTFAYDSLGNITSKTGVGSYTYGSATVRPHAVASVTGTVNGVVNPSYTYDANGNQTIGAGRTLGYTSFNVPKSVTMATISQSYAYDAEHQRIVMTEGSANTTTYINPRWDAGTHFEKETKGKIDEYKHYIYAGGRPVALYVVKRDNGTGINSTYTRYLHTDHLGSVDTITSETGAVLERLSYDTFGKRRNANGNDSATQLTSAIDHHGYTGHEMLDTIGLINMNGRWYDPTLGRMMQADSTIQAPFNLQSFNRYSYVINNPLSLTDPSGYNWWSDRYQAAKHSKTTQAVVGIVVVVVVCIYTSGTGCAAAVYGGAKAHELDKKTHGKLDWKLLAAYGTLEGFKAYGIMDGISTGLDDLAAESAVEEGLMKAVEVKVTNYVQTQAINEAKAYVYKTYLAPWVRQFFAEYVDDPILVDMISSQFVQFLTKPGEFSAQFDEGWGRYGTSLVKGYARAYLSSKSQSYGLLSKYLIRGYFSNDPAKYFEKQMKKDFIDDARSAALGYIRTTDIRNNPVDYLLLGAAGYTRYCYNNDWC